MSRDILLSILLHLVIVAATLVTAPFEIKPNNNYDEIIRVKLTAQADLPSNQPVPLEPVPTPQPIVDDMPDIPVSAPTTMKEAPVTTKPKPKKNKKKKKKTSVKKKNTNGKKGESKEVETPGGNGSPFAGATIDNASFNYPYWFTQAFNKISSNFNNTILYDGTLICVVYFQVIRSGRVIELRVEKSSGIPEFDRICLEAVERSAPFPPLPNEFRDEIIGITLPIKVGPN